MLAFVENHCMSMHAPLLQALARGTLLDGRYRVGRFIGRGTSGEVYEARDLHRGVQIAIKTLGAPQRRNREVLQRWNQAVRCAELVRHANVARGYGCSAVALPDGTEVPFLAMELVRGPTLREFVRVTGPLPMHRCLLVARQLLLALDAAHSRGVFHGALTAAKVLLWCPRGRGARLPLRAVIVGFGMADAVLGTQVREREVGRWRAMDGDRVPAMQADLEGVGKVVCELLSGDVPCDDTGLDAASKALADPLPAGLPPGLEKFLCRCLGRGHQHYASALEALEALEVGARAPRSVGNVQNAR